MNLSPETIAVVAGRPDAPGSPLNQPLVLAGVNIVEAIKHE